MTGSTATTDAKERISTSSLAFLGRAGAWALLLFGLVRIPWVQQHLLLPFARLQGNLACSLVGTDPTSIYVGLSCTGADPMALVLASVLAFPVSWRQRVKGGAIGLALILALNTLRLATLSLVAGRTSLFNLLHVYVWPALLIIAAAAYVFQWMGSALAPRVETPTNEPAALPFSRPATIRFVSLLVLFVLGFYALSPWLMRSAVVLDIARWATKAAAGLMTLLGVPAEVTGNYLRTPHGVWIVTQSCIATPLLPVYLAAVAILPTSLGRRILAAAAALPLFLALGSARLLVLAVPAAVLGSHSMAVHAFYQVLAATVIVAATAWLSAPGQPSSTRLGVTVRSLATGLVAGIVGSLAYRAWLLPAFEFLAEDSHLGHSYDDAQGALVLTPPFVIGLFLALLVALRRPIASRGALIGLGVVALGGLGALIAVGETAAHLGFEVPIALIRATSLALPVLVAWRLFQTSGKSRAPAPLAR